jgi:hypothetical protein
VKAEVAYVGMKVRVGEEHRILERRSMVGKVVGRYGGEVYVVVDVRFSDGRRRLFCPEDLVEEEVSSSPRPSWWHSLMQWLAGDERVQEAGDSSGGPSHQRAVPVIRLLWLEADADISKDGRLETARQ